MAVPKRKYAKARQGERRSHLHLTPANLTSCPQCHAPRLPHRVCPQCGYYKGNKVIEVEKAAKTT